MESEKLMSQENLDALVGAVWQRTQESILKQVEYSIATEMSTRARSRARDLIAQEVDAILKPKIESMKSAMKERVNQIAVTLLPKLEEAMRRGMEDAIRDVSEYVVRQVLAQSETNVRRAMQAVLTGEKIESPV
jgi:hypothetical protein